MLQIERPHLPTSFGTRLQQAFDSRGQLCVGVDPHAALLDEWGLPDDAMGLQSFAETVIEAATDRVGIIKPQVSFFERHGSKGFAVLERVCVLAAEAKLLVIMDAKRGDIGSTMEAYFDAWLGQNAPFLSDALTVSPYLGFGSLRPTLSAAAERGKGVFVLSATSNPEGAVLQQAISSGGQPIAAEIWTGLGEVNAVTAPAANGMGSFGAVIGATVNPAKYGMPELTTATQAIRTPILAPGFGAQGARLVDTGRLFGAAAGQVIANVSRSVLSGGAGSVAELIDQANGELLEGLA